MTFTLNGVRFVVSVIPIRAEKLIAKMGEANGVNDSKAKVVYRPDGIILDSSAAGRKQIHLRW